MGQRGLASTGLGLALQPRFRDNPSAEPPRTEPTGLIEVDLYPNPGAGACTCTCKLGRSCHQWPGLPGVPGIGDIRRGYFARPVTSITHRPGGLMSVAHPHPKPSLVCEFRTRVACRVT